MVRQTYVTALLVLTLITFIAYLSSFSSNDATYGVVSQTSKTDSIARLIGGVFKPPMIPPTRIANLNGTLEMANVSFNPVFNSKWHIYTIDNKPLLFLYWNKNEMPPHIQLSLETIKCHAHNEIHIVLGNTQFALSHFNESKEQFPWLSPNHQADYYRSSMLLKYGGMYMDSDTIQTNSVRYLFDHLVKFDIFGADWKPEGAPISISNMGPMRAGNLLLTKWKSQADKLLKDKYDQLKNYSTGSGPYPLQWAEVMQYIMEPTMTDLLANNQINYTFIDGATTYGQLTEQGYLPLLFQPINKDSADRAKQLNFTVDFLYYFNSRIGHLASLSMEEFLSKKFLFTEIIRKAISQCKAWRNGLYDSDLIRKLNISAFNGFSFQDN